MIFDVALDGFDGCPASGQNAIAVCPKQRLPVKAFEVFCIRLAYHSAADRFKVIDQFGGLYFGVGGKQNMHMVGLSAKLDKL